MAKMSINVAMVTAKALRGRLAELSSLRSQSSTREQYYGGDMKKSTEPTYDVKVLDKKCVEIENFLMDLDAAVKSANAITIVELEGDVKALMTPLD